MFISIILVFNCHIDIKCLPLNIFDTSVVSPYKEIVKIWALVTLKPSHEGEGFPHNPDWDNKAFVEALILVPPTDGHPVLPSVWKPLETHGSQGALYGEGKSRPPRVQPLLRIPLRGIDPF